MQNPIYLLTIGGKHIAIGEINIMKLSRSVTSHCIGISELLFLLCFNVTLAETAFTEI